MYSVSSFTTALQNVSMDPLFDGLVPWDAGMPEFVKGFIEELSMVGCKAWHSALIGGIKL